VGKWIGKRGSIVSEIINNNPGIFLGDNSGRPFFWSAPEQFKAGLKKGAYTLRGTDPLNIKSREKKTGSFGFYFVSPFDIEKPWESLKTYLSGLKNEPDNYGSLESAGEFVKNQLMLRINKLNRN
jgi:hypothetical protein